MKTFLVLLIFISIYFISDVSAQSEDGVRGVDIGYNLGKYGAIILFVILGILGLLSKKKK